VHNSTTPYLPALLVTAQSSRVSVAHVELEESATRHVHSTVPNNPTCWAGLGDTFHSTPLVARSRHCSRFSASQYQLHVTTGTLLAELPYCTMKTDGTRATDGHHPELQNEHSPTAPCCSAYLSGSRTPVQRLAWAVTPLPLTRLNEQRLHCCPCNCAAHSTASHFLVLA
jgi:hypothetical protein